MSFSISGFGRTQVDNQETIPVWGNSAIEHRKFVVQVQCPCHRTTE